MPLGISTYSTEALTCQHAVRILDTASSVRYCGSSPYTHPHLRADSLKRRSVLQVGNKTFYPRLAICPATGRKGATGTTNQATQRWGLHYQGVPPKPSQVEPKWRVQWCPSQPILLTIGRQQMRTVGEFCSTHPPVFTVIKPSKGHQKLCLAVLFPVDRDPRDLPL